VLQIVLSWAMGQGQVGDAMLGSRMPWGSAAARRDVAFQ